MSVLCAPESTLRPGGREKEGEEMMYGTETTPNQSIKQISKNQKMIGAANNSTNVIGRQKPLPREANHTRSINAEFFCIATML